MRLKKVLSVVLAAGMTLSMGACGKSGSKDSSKQDWVNYVFAKDDSFSDVEATDIYKMTKSGNDLYYFTVASNGASGLLGDSGASDTDASDTDASASDAFIETEGTEEQVTATFYKTSVEGGEAEELGTFQNEPGDGFNKIYVDINGKVIIYIDHYGDEGYTSYACVLENGKFVENDKLSELYHGAQDEGESLMNILFDSKNNYYFIYNNSVRITDADFNEISTATHEDYIDAACIDKNDNLIIGYSKTNDSDGRDTMIQKYDMSSNSFGESIKIDLPSFSYDSLQNGGGKYDFFIKSQSNVQGYDLGAKKLTKIFEYDSSDIDVNSINCLTMLDENNFVCIYAPERTAEYGNTTSISRFKKVDPKDVDKRIVLTLALTQTNYSLKEAAQKYNDSQTKYKIKVKDYSEMGDSAAQLSADIAAGNIPDMYEVSVGIADMTMDQAISKNLIEDLTPYLEKDKELSKDDFIPSVYDAMCRDGKLYFVSDSFYVSTIIANANETGDSPEWTYTEMRDYVTSKPAGTRLFAGTSKTYNLTQFLNQCIPDFVDWEKGECSFDGDDFKALLEMCNTGDMEETDDYSMSSEELVKNKKQLFLDYLLMYPKFDFYDQLYGKAVIKGYPAKSGAGFYARFNTCIAMSSKCEDKDGAWEFMRDWLTKDHQGNNLNYGGVPVREDIYKMFEDRLAAKEDGKDEYGEYMTFEGLETDEGSFNYVSHAYTDDELARYRSIIDNISGMNQKDEKISVIISEEAEAYFNGDKSLDEVCKIIQNRVSTYVNENK